MFRPMTFVAAVFVSAVAMTTAASAQHPVQSRELYGADTNRYQNQPSQQRDWRDSNAFWPGQVAAGVVGGAIGAAGAIATAPFQAGYQGGYDMRSYAERNGFVCLPGTTFRGEDGRMHLCQ